MWLKKRSDYIRDDYKGDDCIRIKGCYKWLENTLHLAYTKDDKDDGDYLKQIALTESKWRWDNLIVCIVSVN